MPRPTWHTTSSHCSPSRGGPPTGSDPQHLDYGSDLFGGLREMYGVKPYRRTPRWRSRRQGPPANFDVALHLDFVDADGNEAYNDHAVHHEVVDYNAAICDAELTARVDWYYEGGYLTRPGHVRHCEMFVWDDDVADDAKQAALDAVGRLEAAPEVESVVIGRNVGSLPTDFDWILDVQVADQLTRRQLLDSDLYADVMRDAASLTKHEWTARLTHVMRGIRVGHPRRHRCCDSGCDDAAGVTNVDARSLTFRGRSISAWDTSSGSKNHEWSR